MTIEKRSADSGYVSKSELLQIFENIFELGTIKLQLFVDMLYRHHIVRISVRKIANNVKVLLMVPAEVAADDHYADRLGMVAYKLGLAKHKIVLTIPLAKRYHFAKKNAKSGSAFLKHLPIFASAKVLPEL